MKNPADPGRILLVTPYTVPDYSGSGINAFHFARFLNKENLKATILTFNRNLKYRSGVTTNDVPIIRIPYYNRNLFTKILSLGFIGPYYILYVIRSDIIIIYGGKTIAYQVLILLCKITGKKVIFQSLLLDVDDIPSLLANKNRILKYFESRLFEKIDLYHSITPAFFERFKELITVDNNILICPQGVDIQHFHPFEREEVKAIKQKYGINVKDFIILSIGFVIPRKGFLEIIKVLETLSFDFRYFIIGENEFGKNHFLFHEHIQAIHIMTEGKKLLGDKLIFAGTKDKMVDYYNMADLLVFNSDQEGLPNTLLEAMACGCPVLFRDLPGISNYILHHKENGILFGNSREMKNWIVRLYNDENLRRNLGKKAVDKIKQTGSFPVTWQKINEILYGET